MPTKNCSSTQRERDTASNRHLFHCLRVKTLFPNNSSLSPQTTFHDGYTFKILNWYSVHQVAGNSNMQDPTQWSWRRRLRTHWAEFKKELWKQMVYEVLAWFHFLLPLLKEESGNGVAWHIYDRISSTALHDRFLDCTTRLHCTRIHGQIFPWQRKDPKVHVSGQIKNLKQCIPCYVLTVS